MRKLVLIGSLMLLIAPLSMGAYGVETHAAITLEMARFFNQHYPKRALTQAEMRILSEGAINEDDGLRMLNHFYDPIHQKGLKFAGIQYRTSKDWSQNSVAQAGLVNNALALVIDQDNYDSSDFAWRRAIEDYARGNEERGLEGLGHVLHLIEDLTVPAHVRNDPHPPADTVGQELGDDDPYEHWSHKFHRKNINILVHMRGRRPIEGLGSLNKYFDELAKYTNTRFFSKDTIDKGNFSMPAIGSLSSEETKNGRILWGGDGGSRYVVAYQPNSYTPTTKASVSTDDERVSQSTWDVLSVKALEYGAGVIDLFFDEVEKLKADPNFTEEAKRSLLGQFIDTIGENVQALIDGPPAPQAAPVVKAPTPPDEVVTNEPVEQIVEDEVIEPIKPPVASAAPEPLPESAPASSAKSVSSGHSGGSDDEEVIEEAPIDEPVEEAESDEDPPVADPEPIVEPAIEIDSTAPGEVSSLEAHSADEDSVLLRWLATGDDGSVGTATGYEIRYSQQEITSDSWTEAAVFSQSLTPRASGEVEELTITGLSPSTLYYVALKVRDESGNESLLSNVVSMKTGIGAPDHLVISEIATHLPAFDAIQQFIELYNPTDAPISLAGYSVQYLAGSAADISKLVKLNLSSSASVAPRGFYLIQTKYPGGILRADEHWRESLSASGGTVFLVNSQANISNPTDSLIIDKVAYGSGALLYPEGAAASAPATWASIERRALKSGSCLAPSGGGVFAGNGCDTSDNSTDFVVSSGPNMQKRSHLPEPRTKPSVFAPSISYDPPSGNLSFSWAASVDALGGSAGITYRLTDITNAQAPVVIHQKAGQSATLNPKKVGLDFKVQLEAIDRDGLASDPIEGVIAIPSYLTSIDFVLDGAAASTSPPYAVRLTWDGYPFIPGGSSGWHLVVFYYNEDAKDIPYLGQLNSGHNWGAGISMPSTFKTEYPNCFGGNFATNNTASLILPDDAAHCDGLFGNIKASAIDFGLLRDSALTLPILPQTFSGSTPVPGESYITVAYYAYNHLNPLGLDMPLVAVDKTRYYLSE